MGLFHSTKMFENLGTAEDGAEISRKKIPNFWNAHHSTENSRNSGSKVEWKENFWYKIFEHLCIPREVVLSWNFWKMLFHSLLEVTEILKRHFDEWKTPVVSANWIWRISRDWSQSETSKYFEWIINDVTLRHFPWAYTCDVCVAIGFLRRASGLFAASELLLNYHPQCKQDTWPSYLHVRECRKHLKLWSYWVKAKLFFGWTCEL